MPTHSCQAWCAADSDAEAAPASDGCAGGGGPADALVGSWACAWSSACARCNRPSLALTCSQRAGACCANGRIWPCRSANRAENASSAPADLRERGAGGPQVRRQLGVELLPELLTLRTGELARVHPGDPLRGLPRGNAEAPVSPGRGRDRFRRAAQGEQVSREIGHHYYPHSTARPAASARHSLHGSQRIHTNPRSRQINSSLRQRPDVPRPNRKRHSPRTHAARALPIKRSSRGLPFSAAIGALRRNARSRVSARSVVI